MEDGKKSQLLSIFLIKEGHTTISSIVDESSASAPITITISGIEEGQLYVRKGFPKYPDWTGLFAPVIDIAQIGKTTSLSAVLVVKRAGRYFALAFGQGGRFLLRDDVFEERFGLLVALNSVDRDSLRCVDKQSLDRLESHTRIQSGHATSADQFGLDVEQDMLKAIVGAPKDHTLGARMTGTDSLSVTVTMDLADLPALLTAYKQKFEEDLSAKDYQWVNNIAAVKSSSAMIVKLEALLLEKFEKKDHSNLWLSIPDIIQWDLVKGFSYTGAGKVIHHDVNLEHFLGTIKEGTKVTMDLLKGKKVFCLDADHKPVFKNWSVLRCLYAEIDLDGEKYVLNDGKWFRINLDFVQKTNEAFATIDKSKLILPVYKGGGEGSYNKSVSDVLPDDYYLLDADKVFHGGGQGQVEICDLFSSLKNLIHVKIYGKSNVFSHLFSQGFVSGQLIQIDGDFRQKFQDKLPENFKALVSVAERPKDKEFTVTFAVISDADGSDLHLPFFSRVNLNNTTKVLKGFGYNVELLKIPVDPDFAMTKLCPPVKT